ncbi:uncharacterized protein K452DRAFT_314061 [Aplosporella prunicola CBS 121167]|uniref:Uncharacterized protein n=1 Tax=Aplosporella prunicola CBS 121167 TaxID=1176127 RepID=A0A6A6AXR1_9PEZI|nr:uncharacterized protein K452DRAFT_314061 [Aplosporella prunicola CBS 121167]KAF2135351.1 hypothetical protein K452DRAFT_314061 [Aplosporella prunicola CBS 121167]
MTGRGPPSHPQVPRKWYGEPGGLFGMFVLADVPTNILDEILDEIYEEFDCPRIWLATDTVEVPITSDHPNMTITPLDPSWRSPYLGKTIPNIVNFLKSLPQSEDFDRRHFLTIDEECIQGERRWIKGYRIEGGLDDKENEWTEVAGEPVSIATLVFGYEIGDWEELVQAWTWHGRAIK